MITKNDHRDMIENLVVNDFKSIFKNDYQKYFGDNEIKISDHCYNKNNTDSSDNNEWVGYSYRVNKDIIFNEHFREVLPKTLGRGISVFEFPSFNENFDFSVSSLFEKINSEIGDMIGKDSSSSSFCGIYKNTPESDDDNHNDPKYYIVVYAFCKKTTDNFLDKNNNENVGTKFKTNYSQVETNSLLYRTMIATKIYSLFKKNDEQQECYNVQHDNEIYEVLADKYLINNELTSSISPSLNKIDHYDVFNEAQTKYGKTHFTLQDNYIINMSKVREVNMDYGPYNLFEAYKYDDFGTPIKNTIDHKGTYMFAKRKIIIDPHTFYYYIYKSTNYDVDNSLFKKNTINNKKDDLSFPLLIIN